MPDGKVLVTGATGFIAGHCIDELLTHGYAVRGTVRDLETADVAHLWAIARRTGGSLEFVETSLDADAGWGRAVDGCSDVWHIASPVPANVPKDENEVIRPAVEGTLRVLRAAAASGTVRRVVMTSSTDAITYGHRRADQVRTEASWSNAGQTAPYPKSKVYAEKAAWEFVADQPLELVTINPGLVLGPLLRREQKISMEVIRMLLANKLPAIPRLSFPVVDVRDVSLAHRLAMETPKAAGNRYICVDKSMWMGDIAGVLHAEFGPRGYRIPARVLPYWLMWVGARFDKTMRLALGNYGVPVRVSPDKAKQELGWTPRSARESIIAAGESLIRYGIVPPRGRDKDANPLTAADTAA
ncbi:SDR family oxidoreductase [Actinomadura coerulea]|uniref:SDR family oxidoreductase n=1 Tax=Actinomadura coerulea TaxID=46159 RepID=UPI0034340D1F